MGRLANRMIVLSTLIALGGCALETASEDDELGVQEEELYSPFPRRQPPSLTLYSEAGRWGTSLRVPTAPVGRDEALRLITTTEIQTAGLLGRISSLRLACGTRDAHVVLFPAYNTDTTLWGWSPFGDGHVVDCLAGQTVDVELHSAAPWIADRVGSIYFVAHTTEPSEIALAWLVTSSFRAALANDPPDGASPDGNAQLTLRGERAFDLRQDFVLDDALCGDRHAHFVIRALLQGSTWTVFYVSSYVDTGWGDTWGCRAEMQRGIEAGGRQAAAELAVGLVDAMAFAGSHPRHYLVPSTSLRDFVMISGGDDDTPVLSP